MVSRLLVGVFLATLLVFSGCSSGDIGEQFTLDVESTILIDEQISGNPLKWGVMQPQNFSGTVLVEIQTEFFSFIVVNVLELNAENDVPGIGTVQLTIDPNERSLGTLFLRDDNNVPVGNSTFSLYPQLILPGSQVVDFGLVMLEDQGGDPDEIPLLGNIPILDFIFNGQPMQAQIQTLTIILTPDIVSLL